MAHIDAVGGYVPLYRVERATVAEQHGGSASGETAVSGRDETLVSMASEAADTALARSSAGASDLGGVFAASVTDPFAEHGVAAHVAHRHGATGDVRTGDFRATPRAATDAFVTALRAVEATGDPALVVAADELPVEPGHDDEPYSGAGAGAVVLGAGAASDEGDDDGTAGEAAARVHGVGQATTGFVERHREHGEVAESGDRRFEGEAGFGEAMPDAAQRALGTAPAMPEAAVVAAPDQRLASNAVSEFPGDVEHVSTFDGAGYAGTASWFLDLAHLVESADEGTTAVAACYGAGGADAVALTVTDPASEGGLTVAAQLTAKEHVTYAEHLRYRKRPDYEGVTME